MVNQQQLTLLKQGADVWNRWRSQYQEVQPDLQGAVLKNTSLSGVDLSDADLGGVNLSDTDLNNSNLRRANLRRANLRRANLSEAHLSEGDLSGADLREADLSYAHLRRTTLKRTYLSGADLHGAEFNEADLSGAWLMEANLREARLNDTKCKGTDLRKADLRNTNLSGANLNDADLRKALLQHADLCGADLTAANLSDAELEGADLSGADLRAALLVRTNLINAILTNCFVYGIAAWDVQLQGARQDNLVITPDGQPVITVDNLEVAQFIYLLLKNQKIRDVINTIGQKAVLILGRFSQERKPVLDALREKLRALNFLPIVFDFERPTELDFTETIMTLAGLSCFIIADITNPKSSPLELQATVPDYMIPFVPIIQDGEQPFSMFRDLKGKYAWVLELLVYDTPSNLCWLHGTSVQKTHRLHQPDFPFLSLSSGE